MKSKILVVDDDAEICALLTDFILNSDLGVTVMTAPSVDKAMALVSQHHPEVIISDVLMPGKTGLDFLAAIRGQGIATPFLMMSGYGDTDLIRKAWRLGAFHFLSKPIDADTLIEIVSECLKLADEYAERNNLADTKNSSSRVSINLDPKILAKAKKAAGKNGLKIETWVINLVTSALNN